MNSNRDDIANANNLLQNLVKYQFKLFHLRHFIPIRCFYIDDAGSVFTKHNGISNYRIESARCIVTTNKSTQNASESFTHSDKRVENVEFQFNSIGVK